MIDLTSIDLTKPHTVVVVTSRCRLPFAHGLLGPGVHHFPGDHRASIRTIAQKRTLRTATIYYLAGDTTSVLEQIAAIKAGIPIGEGDPSALGDEITEKLGATIGNPDAIPGAKISMRGTHPSADADGNILGTVTFEGTPGTVFHADGSMTDYAADGSTTKFTPAPQLKIEEPGGLMAINPELYDQIVRKSNSELADTLSAKEYSTADHSNAEVADTAPAPENSTADQTSTVDENEIVVPDADPPA